jgi:HD-GYP domain-containing protein (c-di-GMP phosphodiesterase class II)
MLTSDSIGSKLAVPIYNDNGMIFLNSGIVLTENYITAAKNLGVNTVYIDDGNEDVTLQEILNSSIKLKLSKLLKSEFDKISKNRPIDETVIKNIVSEIMKEINLSENAFLYNNIGQVDKIMSKCVHSIDVAVLSLVVGITKKYDEKKLLNLGIGALLHDIGKLIEEGKSHPAAGYKYIKANTTTLSPTSSIVILHHHENIDGTGYPNKISGDKIYEFAKIVSICDEYINSITSRGQLPHTALENITAQTSTRFDPEIYNLFTQSIYCYPNGLSVKLNNGKQAIVIMQNKNFPLRPIVFVQDENHYAQINLLEELTLFVEQVLV